MTMNSKNKSSNKKICAVITARTSYTKMKSILTEFKNYKNISLKIICAASAVSENYGNLENQIKNGISEREIRLSWKADIDKYKIIRKKYLLSKDFE